MANLGEANIGGRMVPAWLVRLTAEELDGLKWHSNRNLLDNWYFGNPVDQRGGYVVPPGVVAYSDAALSIPTGGTTDMYYKIVEKTATYGRFVGNDSLNYYVSASDCVRGYTGAGYGMDRWKLLTSQCTVTIDNDGITLHRNGGDQWIYEQPLEPEFVTALTGKSVVISTLTDAGLVELPVSSAFTAEQSVVSTSGTCIWLSTAGYLFLGTTADSVKLKATKLELGTVQTLAHQDENGNWVLNDPPPDKGTELAKCQRCCKIYGSISPTLSQPFLVHGFWRKVSDWLQVTMVCPEFRAVPVVSILDGNWLLFDGEATYPIGQIDVYSYIPGVVTLSITSPGNNFSNGKPLALFCNSGRLMLSADL